jgi:hypothetical protein
MVSWRAEIEKKTLSYLDFVCFTLVSGEASHPCCGAPKPRIR